MEQDRFQKDQAEELQWRQRMEELARQQADYARKQYNWTRVSTILKIVILAVVIAGVILCVSRVTALAGQAQSVLTELQNALMNLESAAESLKNLASQAGSSSGVDLSKLEEAIEGLTRFFESNFKFPSL